MNEDQEPKEESIQKDIFAVVNDIIIKLGMVAQHYRMATKECEGLQEALKVEKSERHKSESMLQDKINRLNQKITKLETADQVSKDSIL